MNVIKRSGKETTFEKEKILSAIKKANQVTTGSPMSEEDIDRVVNEVVVQCKKFNRALHVEEIQDLVENSLMAGDFYKVARNYITYRYERSLARKANTTDQQILSLINRNNEEIKQENSNKNPSINSVQRDYMAGEVSKDISKRFLIPQDVWEAHEQGILHFHKDIVA